MTSGGINHHVDVRKWKGVLGTCLVQVGEVDAYSPLPVLRLYNHHIGQPVGVMDLTD